MREGIRTTIISGDLSPQDGADWDGFVTGVDQSDVAQLTKWGRVRLLASYQPRYVLVRSGSELVGGAQVLTRKVRGFGAIGYVPYGPVIGGGVGDRQGVSIAISRTLRSLMSNGKLRLILVQPPWGADEVSSSLMQVGFRKVDAGIAPAASTRINLELEVESLRALLSKRLRAWTTKWPQRGVTVRTGDSSDLPLLADLLAKSASYQGFEAPTLEYLQRQFDELSPDNVVLFVGEFKGEPVAVDLFTASGGTLRDRLIGMDRESEASNLSVPGAVKWNAMLWAKENGMRWFDLGGIDREVARTMLAGKTPDRNAITGSDQFKLSFGGEAYLLPPAVGLARPGSLLRAYELAKESGAGQLILDAVRRRLRGRS